MIANPTSNRGSAHHQIDQIRHALISAGIPFDLAITKCQGDAEQIAKQAYLDRYRFFAVAGGDGTVSEVVNGLSLAIDEGEPVGTLAIFPIGTANDFAAMLGYDQSVEQVVQLIHQGVVRQVDLGHVVYQMDDEKRERIFCNNFGIGLEAVVASNMNRGPDLIWQWLPGHYRYIIAALQTIVSYHPIFLEVSWLSAAGRIEQIGDTTLMVRLNQKNK
ncbi:hypothetical protein KFU94_23145 [Chloroflexi bacterium TSY]|nr:hypothetical protein [Chloroflexi bacterium TSY]